MPSATAKNRSEKNFPLVPSARIIYPMAGVLIAYGTSIREATKDIAVYADKILKGAQPGDLPIEAVLRHELVINLWIARKLGMTVPLELLERASQVID